MTIASVRYLAFLAAAGTVYFLLPAKRRAAFLLLASYGFYAMWQPAFCLLLLAGTLVSYFCAGACARGLWGRRRMWIALGAAYLFGMLLLYKYLDFFCSAVLALAGRPEKISLGLVLPVGISFYTFSAASYLFDVAKGKTPAEKNFIHYALFLSFFPAILSGPIHRADKLLPQIRRSADFSWRRMKQGLLRFAEGAVKKLVLADTLAQFVDAVYRDAGTAPGGILILAALLYSLQIYFDFAGYTDMALGSAQILGYELAENFSAPYLTRSVKEFWKRWHMSLTSWFRDYVYFPLGGSRCSRARTYGNVLTVFALSGLWHGADTSFLLWGLLNGLYQVLGQMLSPARAALRRGLGIRENHPVLALAQGAGSFLLITAAWVLFRADSTAQALQIFAGMAAAPLAGLSGGGLHAYIGFRQLALALLLTLLFTAADGFKLRQGRGVLAGIEEKSFPFWLVLTGLALLVAVFGVYGPGYDAGSFVYFRF